MRVAIRTDASPQIGTGHLARCQTLADALALRGAQVRFVCRHLTEGAAGRLQAAGHAVTRIDGAGEPDGLPHAGWLGGAQAEDAARTRAALAGFAADWLIVDHYALDVRWERVLRERVRRIMVIDDLADRDHECDLLLDQNLYADTAVRYAQRVPAAARRLLGPRYALLRPEFTSVRGRRRDGGVRRVLVFFGGVDAANQTGRVIALLPRVLSAQVAVDVVIGAAHPHRADIEAACAQAGYCCHVQTARMAELMAAADLAIGAGGTAVWERACAGLPALVWPVADNQHEQVATAADAGVLHAPLQVGHDDEALLRQIVALCESPHLLRALSAAGAATVDGAGAARVCRALGCTGVTIRPAVAADGDNLFAWRNREAVRRVSRNRDPIPRPAHDAWLADTLGRADRRLLVGERNGQALGVVRFDLVGDEAEVSIYLAPGEHGTGAGSELLAAAERWLVLERPAGVCKIRAEVAGDNAPSRHMFLSAGYLPDAARFFKRILPDD
ncbi:UDP-2,4-diacetamido-2,4,6-trideoxy-beta-L-altropyranose hydrolase [Methyloversatilis discipulorum]|uniref:UDP-2,4-diacetamido-2,4, 6-trideoxy-beta-L-altropyranose hydrolase n=1 Tax=Methyloversatilis discipulorum TaxID=1119528 RepID=UPI00035DEFE4|nr:UDP-2,4-diacetamido-2,4,6-trideoxy-beta-L-altropyranose hydrolase [Methyloversatilis discipulorum]